MGIVQVNGLSFEYPGKRVLDGIDFTLAENSITALVGANGSGKTTLLRCVAALENPFSGNVKIMGYDTQEAPRSCHSNLGYLSDSFGLYDDLSVARCLRHIAAVRGVSSSCEDEIVRRAAEKSGLTSLLGVRAGVLSRGQRQRLGIAQAIIHSPKVLLLDEPASGLDPEARTDLSGLLLELKATGMTILVSSHILAELEDYCDNMLTLAEGKIRAHVAIRDDGKKVHRDLKVNLAVEQVSQAAALISADTQVSHLSTSEGTCLFRFAGTLREQAALLEKLVSQGITVFSFSEERRTMQDVYLDQIAETKRES
jgi:ABC-2 type transport system ATP-binding protein